MANKRKKRGFKKKHSFDFEKGFSFFPRLSLLSLWFGIDSFSGAFFGPLFLFRSFFSLSFAAEGEDDNYSILFLASKMLSFISLFGVHFGAFSPFVPIYFWLMWFGFQPEPPQQNTGSELRYDKLIYHMWSSLEHKLINRVYNKLIKTWAYVRILSFHSLQEYAYTILRHIISILLRNTFFTKCLFLHNNYIIVRNNW